MPDPNTIARVLGGEVRGQSVHMPTPGHSRRDRGTVVTVSPDAPDGVLVHSFNGGDPMAIKDDLRAAGVLPPLGQSGLTGSPRWRETGVYVYDDGGGKPLFRTRRLEATGYSKRFVAERLEGEKWVAGLGDIERLPYRFTDLVEAAERAREAGEPEPPILFVEGERKADKLASWGFLATAVAFGASGWREEYGECFATSTVVILPDNDEPGRKFAETVKAGIEDWGGHAVVLELPGLPPKGDIIDWAGTPVQLREMVAKALAGEPPEPLLAASPYVWADPDTLPRRPWIYGRQLLRGSVFLVVAPGATGKSALLIGMAMALCSGRPLLDNEVWGGAKRVWLWNLEDSLSELRFSIQAAAKHWGLGASDLDGQLFVDSGLEGAALRLAVQARDGGKVDEIVSRSIIDELARRDIDVLVIDPFISSHGLAENDNAAIDLVAKEWSKIAAQAGCAVVLVHHARKAGGEVVTAESARGASALVDAARGGLALNTMTEAEADRFGIERDDRRRYFRADDAKPNRAPPGAGQWFHLVSVHLGNGPDGGDSVGVATPWSPPDPFDDVTADHLRQVQAKIADGEWKESPQSSEWAGLAVADVLDLDTTNKADKAKAASILKTWIKNGALRVERRRCSKRREDKNFVLVGDPA